MIASRKNHVFYLLFALIAIITFVPQHATAQKSIDVAPGWAKNSVNTVIFRKNALTSFKNFQFISFYDKDGYVVLGRRTGDSKHWDIQKTKFKGSVSDAHRSISIAIDGDGYLHLSWDHHNTRLRYAKSVRPLSLEMGPEQEMTGLQETRLSYPEFYRLPGGDLLFLYRDGSSGNGSLVINRYHLKSRKWVQVQHNLIEGEGRRNAYWQTCIDNKGIIHISWVWRESPDVASNHDICYARSKDGGITWERSDGSKYNLPITAANAEYAVKIPQKSELINQTSMTANAAGAILIATYWRAENEQVPQFHVVIKSKNGWQVQNLGFRKTPFSLSGMGTKRIPISRPQVIAWKEKGRWAAGVIFRDEERHNHISVAVNKDITKSRWNVSDIFPEPCGSCEPLYDIDLWNHKNKLQLFVQKNDQVDGEGQSVMEPQMVKVVEWEKR